MSQWHKNPGVLLDCGVIQVKSCKYLAILIRGLAGVWLQLVLFLLIELSKGQKTVGFGPHSHHILSVQTKRQIIDACGQLLLNPLSDGSRADNILNVLAGTNRLEFLCLKLSVHGVGAYCWAIYDIPPRHQFPRRSLVLYVCPTLSFFNKQRGFWAMYINRRRT